jgi:2-keto-3-deoxy-L-rhamnonate aldolase RhmA
MDSVEKFKAAMDSDRGALGPFMITCDPAFVEAAGHVGYDFALIDLEHGTVTMQQLPNMIRAANVAGICPVVRVPRGTDIWIDQALDVGAGAIMIPQIDTAEQARLAIRAAKFAPLGLRGSSRSRPRRCLPDLRKQAGIGNGSPLWALRRPSRPPSPLPRKRSFLRRRRTDGQPSVFSSFPCAPPSCGD